MSSYAFKMKPSIKNIQQHLLYAGTEGAGKNGT